MKSVFMLWHEYQPDPEVDYDEEKLIGIYETEEKAKAALERIKDLRGFRDYPEGFQLFEQNVNSTGWDEGFVRLLPEEF